MHLQPFFKGHDFISEGVSEELFMKGLCLPSDTKMRDEDLDRVIDIIKSLWK